jgi:hypothetical protein
MCACRVERFGTRLALVSAAVELPVAALMASGALRILQRSSAIVWQLRGRSDMPQSMWKRQFVMLPADGP